MSCTQHQSAEPLHCTDEVWSVERVVLRAEIRSARDEITTLRARNAKLAHQVEVLRKQLFGQKRERLNDSQLEIAFNGDDNVPKPVKSKDLNSKEGEAADKKDDGNAKRSQHRGRRKIDTAKIKVESVELIPPYVAANSDAFVRIGEDVSEHLESVPASIVCVRIVRGKFKLKQRAAEIVDVNRDVNILQVEMPSRPLPRSLAGPGLIAQAAVDKFADHLPLHRQAVRFRRLGIDFSRATIWNWLHDASTLWRHVVNAMWQAALKAPYLMTDATGILVQQKERCHRAHFYVVVMPEVMVLYRFMMNNNGKNVVQLFGGFSGFLHQDASSVYHALLRRESAPIEVACWAHARRKFFEALQTSSQLAQTGIGFISLLYKAAKGDSGVSASTRADRVKIPLENIRSWLRGHQSLIDQKDRIPIAVAMKYVQTHWAALTRFVDDDRLRLDNNLSELNLRTEVIGRKNWLFVGNDAGAEVNTTIVSLVASCALHGIEPVGYLRDTLLLLPDWPASSAIALAPHNWLQTCQKPEVQAALQRLDFVRHLRH